MGVMRILDSSGDTTVAWDINDVDSLIQAENLFEQLVNERKIPFIRAAGASAEDTIQTKSFDAAAEEIIWVRPIAGG